MRESKLLSELKNEKAGRIPAWVSKKMEDSVYIDCDAFHYAIEKCPSKRLAELVSVCDKEYIDEYDVVDILSDRLNKDNAVDIFSARDINFAVDLLVMLDEDKLQRILSPEAYKSVFAVLHEKGKVVFDESDGEDERNAVFNILENYPGSDILNLVKVLDRANINPIFINFALEDSLRFDDSIEEEKSPKEILADIPERVLFAVRGCALITHLVNKVDTPEDLRSFRAVYDDKRCDYSLEADLEEVQAMNLGVKIIGARANQFVRANVIRSKISSRSREKDKRQDSGSTNTIS